MRERSQIINKWVAQFLGPKYKHFGADEAVTGVRAANDVTLLRQVTQVLMVLSSM